MEITNQPQYRVSFTISGNEITIKHNYYKSEVKLTFENNWSFIIGNMTFAFYDKALAQWIAVILNRDNTYRSLDPAQQGAVHTKMGNRLVHPVNFILKQIRGELLNRVDPQNLLFAKQFFRVNRRYPSFSEIEQSKKFSRYFLDCQSLVVPHLFHPSDRWIEENFTNINSYKLETICNFPWPIRKDFIRNPKFALSIFNKSFTNKYEFMTLALEPNNEFTTYLQTIPGEILKSKIKLAKEHGFFYGRINNSTRIKSFYLDLVNTRHRDINQMFSQLLRNNIEYTQLVHRRRLWINL